MRLKKCTWKRSILECSKVWFLVDKAKGSSLHGHTIPVIVLCSSVLAFKLAETIQEERKIPKDIFTFNTDSKVVLESILSMIKCSMWMCLIILWTRKLEMYHVRTEPCRCCSTRELPQSSWLLRPDLLRDDKQLGDQPHTYDFVNLDMDEKVRTQVTCRKTSSASQGSQGSASG